MLQLLEKIRHKRNDQKVFIPALIAASLVSGATSLLIGLRQSVWFDEAYSILVAKQPIGELVRLVGLDTHPPLYYIMLKSWAGLFGWGELPLRLMSVLALVLAIIVAGLLVRRLFSARVAIGAILLLMIAPLLLRYGFEIRMYSVGMLIGVTATYALIAANERKHGYWKWLVLYGVLVAIGMYTMYSLALLWIAHVVWILYIQLKRRYAPKRLGEWIAAYIGAVVLFAPWLPTFLGQATNDALAPIGQPLNMENILGIASFNLLYRPLFQVDAITTILLIAALSVIGWSIANTFRQMRAQREALMLMTLYICVPVAILVLLSTVKSMYVERYLSHVGLGGLMLSGVALTSVLVNVRTKKTIYVILAAYAVVAVGCLQLVSVGNFNFQRMQTPTVRQAAQALRCAPDTTILAADPYVAIELSYYITDCPIYFFSQSEILKGGYAPLSDSRYQVKDMGQLRSRHVTFVYYGEPEQKPVGVYQKQASVSHGALNATQYTRLSE